MEWKVWSIQNLVKALLEPNPSCKCLKRKSKSREIGDQWLWSENCKSESVMVNQVWTHFLNKFGCKLWDVVEWKQNWSTKNYLGQVVQWKMWRIIFLIKAPSCDVESIVDRLNRSRFGLCLSRSIIIVSGLS